MTSIWTWLATKLIVPFLPYILGGLLLLNVATGLFAGWKVYQWASAACQAANDAAEMKAKDATLERYRALLRATELQRATEAARAADTASALQQRAQELEADKAIAEAAQRDVEADLAAAIQDKGKLDAIVQKLRGTARTDCRASDADVRLDERLRSNR